MENNSSAQPNTQNSNQTATNGQSKFAAILARFEGKEPAAPAAKTEAAPAVAPASSQASEPKAATQPAPVADTKLSNKFAALKAQENKIAEEEKKIQSARESWEKEKGAYLSKEELVKMAKDNPDQFFEATGISYDELTRAVLGQDKGAKELSQLKDEVEALKGKLTAKEKEELEQKEKAKVEHAQQVIDQEKQSIRKFVDENSENYELIKTTEAYETVFEVIEAWFREHNELLDIKDACEKVESYYAGQVQKLLQTKKAAALIKPPEKREGTGQPTTLTNDTTRSVPQASGESQSREERFKRAVAIMNKQ